MATTEQLNRLTNAHIPKLPPATPEHEVWEMVRDIVVCPRFVGQCMS